MGSLESYYTLEEQELNVLCAFFLSLPLPPIQVGDGSLPTRPEVLREVAQALSEKGWITQPAAPDAPSVDPTLTKMLQAVAYAPQMVQIARYPLGDQPYQWAFYAWRGQVVKEEVMPSGEHRFQWTDRDMGQSLLAEVIRMAGTASHDARFSISYAGWQDLLVGRALGNKVNLKTSLAAIMHDTVSQERWLFVEDVLDAIDVAGVTVIYDRLRPQQERAFFVVGEHRNWLVTFAAIPDAEPWMQVACLTREGLMKALTALYAPLVRIEGGGSDESDPHGN